MTGHRLFSPEDFAPDRGQSFSLEHETPFQDTPEADAWDQVRGTEDPWENWGDLLGLQLAASPFTPTTAEARQFVRFDLPRPANIRIRLSAISAQAAAGLTVDWQITIGVGRAAQVRHFPQVVQAVLSNADLLLEFPAKNVLIAATVTSTGLATPASVEICAQAAPFYSGADVGVIGVTPR